MFRRQLGNQWVLLELAKREGPSGPLSNTVIRQSVKDMSDSWHLIYDITVRARNHSINCGDLTRRDSTKGCVLRHKTADSIFIYYLVYYYCSVTWLRHFLIVLPFSLTFLLSLLRTHCSLLLDSPLLLRAIVLVTYCSRDSIVLVTAIVCVTLLFSVSI